jgi:hypothetical protein
MPAPNVPQDAQTISEVMRALDAQGYTGQLRVAEGAVVECLTCRNQFPAAGAAAERIVRLEGVSDPADMLAVVALHCPSCNTAATLLLNYGPDSTPEEAEVLLAIDDARSGPGVATTP